ncbi:MAG: sigma-70 family RNA polymerase sigma factor [Planctomycetota bacterium JB042]
MDRDRGSPAESGAARDERWFEAEVAAVAPSLFAWAGLRIPADMRATIAPEDVVQETWVRALEVLPRFDPARGPFRAFVFRVAKNILLESFRRFEAARRTGLGEGGVDESRAFRLEGVPASATAVSQRVARDETLQTFVEEALRLARDDRDLLIACGLEERLPTEVAVELGLTRDAAVKRWQRLRARLSRRAAFRVLLA